MPSWRVSALQSGVLSVLPVHDMDTGWPVFGCFGLQYILASSERLEKPPRGFMELT